jgi:hypothetical protein
MRACWGAQLLQCDAMRCGVCRREDGDGDGDGEVRCEGMRRRWRGWHAGVVLHRVAACCTVRWCCRSRCSEAGVSAATGPPSRPAADAGWTAAQRFAFGVLQRRRQWAAFLVQRGGRYCRAFQELAVARGRWLWRRPSRCPHAAGLHTAAMSRMQHVMRQSPLLPEPSCVACHPLATDRWPWAGTYSSAHHVEARRWCRREPFCAGMIPRC